MPSGHVSPGEPLKPLSAHAYGWLRALERFPARCYMINPGVSGRLLREGLIVHVPVRGEWAITDAGRAKLAARYS
jgi:hypothetical protein